MKSVQGKQDHKSREVMGIPNFHGTAGLLVKSTVREVQGKVAGELLDRLGQFWEVRELPEGLVKSHSLPETRRKCLQNAY